MIEIRRADGTAYRGWTSATVTMGLEQMARSVAVELVGGDAGYVDLTLVAGEAIEVWDGDDPILTGWIDDVEPEYDGTRDSVRITGRSAVSDLVDSSAPTAPLRNISIRALAETYASPYDVDVFDGAGSTDAIRRVKPDAGESIGDVLQRLARDRGILLTDDAVGRLVLYQPSAPRVATTAIERGRNVLACSARFSVAERFSTYECRGQLLDESAVIADAKGLAYDAGIARTRVKRIVPERPLSPADARRLAEWEALRRIGEGQVGTWTLSGWREADGTLWEPGPLVEITDDRCKLHRVRWLLTDVVLSLTPDEGRRAELTCKPLEAFLPYPQPETRSYTPGRGASVWLREGTDGRIVAGEGGGSEVQP